VRTGVTGEYPLARPTAIQIVDVRAPCDRLELRMALASRPGCILRFFWHGLQVTAALGEAQPSELHIAVSRPDRDPTWEELKSVRYTFWPRSAEVVQFLPPPEEYVNVHRHYYHLHGDFDGRRRWVFGEPAVPS
jgi:hypothetical protein